MLPSSSTVNYRTRKRLHREVQRVTMRAEAPLAPCIVNNALQISETQQQLTTTARDQTTRTTISYWSLKRWISPSKTKRVVSAEWEIWKSLLLAMRPYWWLRGYPEPQFKHWQRSQRMNERMLKINQTSALSRLYSALWQSLILVAIFPPLTPDDY